LLRAASVMVIEGWREAIRIGFEYGILAGTICQGDVPPPP